jgi:hypothetical protein
MSVNGLKKRRGPKTAPGGAADCGAEPVTIRFAGREWHLTRGQLCRVPGSLPHRLFSEGSQFLGPAVKREGPGWLWTPADPEAEPEDVHGVVCFLQAPRRLADPPDGVRRLAVRWRLDKAMLSI